MLKAFVYITLKETVADPQGLTVKHALESLGYKGVEEVRMGKYITLKLKSKDKKAAEVEVNEMCKKLLANPIIEDYRFEVVET
jgi:phosphoribosylformylglycinamidine synthase